MYYPSTAHSIVEKFRANSPDLMNLHKLGYDIPQEIKRCLGHKVDNPFTFPILLLLMGPGIQAAPIFSHFNDNFSKGHKMINIQYFYTKNKFYFTILI